MLLNLADFGALLRAGLEPGTTYSFVGRITANLAEDLVKQEAPQWRVVFLGPQQFTVEPR